MIKNNRMRKRKSTIKTLTRNLPLAMLMAILAAGCGQTGKGGSPQESEEPETPDSTIYGVCGQGTMMHTLELITNMRDTLEMHIAADDEDVPTMVCGGLMAGDRIAATAVKGGDGLTASRIVNITSLLGRWTSIDRDFEITEDGEVKSFVRAETRAWTSWRILNGQLLLNRDTFDIINLGADSLEIESRTGIYLFKRIRTDLTLVVGDSIGGHKAEEKHDSL